MSKHNSSNLIYAHVDNSDKAKLIAENHLIERLNKDSLIIDFHMNDEQLKFISRFFPTLPIIYGSSLSWNTHPVFATLTRFCYKNIKHDLPNGAKIVEIGASARSATNTHICIKADSPQDRARYMQTATNCRLYNNRRVWDSPEMLHNAANGYQTSVCTKGVENCHARADIIVSIHAHYDIPIQDNLQIMTNHNCYIMYAYMYLPLGLIDESVNFVESTHYGYSLRFRNDKAVFSMDDGAFVYTHQHENWANYLTTAAIHSENQTVTIEIDRSWGVMHRLKFVRFNRTDGIITRSIPINDSIRGYCRVPNLWDFAVLKDCQDINTILMPIEFYRKAIDYISRQTNESFTFNTFAAYVAANSQQVTLQSQVLWRGWAGETPYNWEAAVRSLYLIGIVQRTDRVKYISEFVSHLKMTQDRSIFGRIKLAFYYCLSYYGFVGQYDRYSYNEAIDGFGDIEHLHFVHAAPITYDHSAKFIQIRKYWTTDNNKIKPYFKDNFIGNNYNITTTLNNKDRLNVANDIPLSLPDDSLLVHKHNFTVTYNPPTTDNKCATFLARYLGYDVDLQPLAYDDELTSALVRHNVVMHTKQPNGYHITYHWRDPSFPYVSIMLQDCHYTIIHCGCPQCKFTISDYSKLPTTKDKIYVNAANTDCTDLGYQAKAFRKLFPNYLKDIQVPLPNPFNLINHEGTDIVVADARHPNNDQEGNMEIIYSNLEKLAIDKRKEIMLPLVGAGSYSKASSLGIIRRHINAYFNIVALDRSTIVGLINDNFGGGLTANVRVENCATNPNFDKWEKEKHNSFNNSLHDPISKYLEVLTLKDIVEISCAPGILMKYCLDNNIKYRGFAYKGQHALQMNEGLEPEIFYHELDELPDLDTDTIFCDIGDITSWRTVLPNIIKYLTRPTHKCRETIVKVFTEYGSDMNMIPVNNYTIIKPTHSKASSSEAYLIYPPRGDNFVPVNYALDQILNEFMNHHIRKDAIKIDYTLEHLNRYHRTIKASDDKFHQTLNDRIIKIPQSKGTINAVCTTGVAGSGKTAMLHFEKNSVFIAPLKTLTDEFSKIKPEIRCYTHEVFLNALTSKGINPTKLYIDEAHMIPIGWFGFVDLIYKYNKIDYRMHLIGDMHQIPLTDFSEVQIYDSSDRVPLPYHWHYNESYRIGPNTSKFINNYLDTKLPKFSSKSIKKDIITIESAPKNMTYIKELKDHKFITLTQANKLMLAKLKYDVSTIHESEGSGFNKVALYIDNKDINKNLIHNYHYTYIALSRHKQELLILYNHPDGDRTYLNLLNSYLEINLDHANVIPRNEVHVVDKILPVRPVEDEKHEQLYTDVDSVETILGNIIHGNEHPIIAISSTNLPEKLIYNDHGDHTKSTIKIKGYVAAKPITVSGRRIGRRNYVAHYHPKDHLTAIRTLIERYTRIPIQQRTINGYNPFFEPIRMLRDGFIKFTRFQNYQEYLDYMSPTMEELHHHMTEYLASCQTKMTTKVYEELNTLYNDYRYGVEQTTFIEHFMKKQCKYISPRENKDILNMSINQLLRNGITINEIYGASLAHVSPEAANKAGQGISSWPKFLNLILCAYTRHVNSKFQNIMATEKDKGYDCVYACNVSDRELSHIFSEKVGKYIGDKQYEKLATDFTQHDTSHSYIIKLWMLKDFLDMGFDACAMAEFFHAYEDWMQTARIDDELIASVHNFFIQHSGSPDTLHGNTKLTMAANGMAYRFRNLRFGSFKGDDSLIVASKIVKLKFKDISNCYHFNIDKDIAELFDFRLKEDYNDPPEFICNIITPCGFFPDVLRRVTRIISKIFNNIEEYDEAKITLKDCVNVITNRAQYEESLHYAAAYYKQLGYNISSQQVDIIFNFCANIDHIALGDQQEFYYEAYTPT